MAERKTKWMNKRDSMFNQYESYQNDYQNVQIKLAESTENRTRFIDELQGVEKKIRDENADEIVHIDQLIKSENSSLRDIEKKYAAYKNGFDEGKAKQESEKFVNDEFEKLQASLINETDGISSDLLRIYNDRKAKKVEGLSELNKNESIVNIHTASEKGYLSDLIDRPYDNEEAMHICRKKGISSGDSLINRLSEVMFPKYINQLIPHMNELVMIGMTVLIFIILVWYMFATRGVADASAGIVGGIFVFIQKLLSAILGALIGAAIAAVIGLVVDNFLGTGLLLKGGAILGGVVGFIIGFNHKGSELSEGAETAVGNFGRIFSIIIIMAIAVFLIACFELHDKASEIIVSKYPVLKNKARQNLKTITDEQPWLYYLLFHAESVLQDICEINDLEKEKELLSRKKELEEKLSELRKAFSDDFDENVRKLVKEKEDSFYKEKGELEQQISVLQQKITELEEEIKMRRNDLDRLVDEKKTELQAKIRKEEENIDKANKESDKIIGRLNEAAESIMSVRFLPLSETQGHISESIYLEVKDKELPYRVIRRIVHNFLPILFLYKGENDGLKNLYPLVEEVAKAFFQNNSLEVVNLNLVDIYNNGIDLSGSRLPFHIFDRRNLGDFNDDIDNTIRFVASSEGDTWNDVIGELVATTGVIEEERRNQISFIIVPPEGSVSISGFEELPTLVRNGKKRGFIPVFFMAEEAYRNYDPEKSSQKYIMEIFSNKDTENYTYRYNLRTGELLAE